jgi:O-antigen/teichoic acid export membrane protein
MWNTIPCSMETDISESAILPLPGVPTVAAGASTSLAGRVTGRVVQAFGQILLARLLGPDTYGLYALALTGLGLAALVAPLGLDRAVIRFARIDPRGSATLGRGFFLRAIAIASLIGLTLAVVVALVAPAAAEGLFHDARVVWVLRWIAPAFALVAGLRVATAATRVSFRMSYTVLTEDLVVPAVSLALAVLMIVAGLGLRGVLAAASIAHALALALAIVFVWRLFPVRQAESAPAKIRLLDLLAFSIPASAAVTLNALITMVDRLAIGSFGNAADLGIYQAAAQVSIWFALVMATFSTVLAPLISTLHQAGDRERLAESYRVATKWGTYLCVPMALLAILVPGRMMEVLFGADYGAGRAALLVLALGQFINVATGAVGPMLIMTGHPRRWAIHNLAALAIAVLLNLLLTPRLGVLGAALSTSSALVVLFGSGLFAVRRTVGMWPYDRRFLKGVVAGAVAAVCLVLVERLAWQPAWIVLVIEVALAFGVFGFVLWRLGLDEEDRMMIRNVAGSLTGKATTPG